MRASRTGAGSVRGGRCPSLFGTLIISPTRHPVGRAGKACSGRLGAGQVFWAGAVAAMAGRDRHEVELALHELTRKEPVRPAG